MYVYVYMYIDITSIRTCADEYTYSNPLNKSLCIFLCLYILDIYPVYIEIYFSSFPNMYWEEDNPKGNQSWIFIGRTDAETEAPILWSLDVKNRFIGKEPDARIDWRQEEKGIAEAEVVGWHHWLNGHEFEQALGVGDREACCAEVQGVAKSQFFTSGGRFPMEL